MITASDRRTTDLFRATDRCDRCAARARVLVVFASGGELMFCDHHLRMHRPALEPLALRFEHHQDRADPP